MITAFLDFKGKKGANPESEYTFFVWDELKRYLGFLSDSIQN